MTDPKTTRARGFWIAARANGEWREEALPPLGPGQALVRARASAISAGTERLVFLGRVPDSQRAIMRCPFQAGEFPWPVKYGYASVGVVEDGPAPLVGRRVFCLHPHQDRYIVPIEALVAVPAHVPDARATLAANLETAVNALWDAPPRPGDHIAVIGAGTVGLCVAMLASATAGVHLSVIETDGTRAAFARSLGFNVVDAATVSPCDLVFHTSGHPAGLVSALSLAGDEATIIEMSWYGDRPVALPLGEAFHARRLRILSSQVGAVAPSRRARWSTRRRLALALDLLADPRYDRLIGATIDAQDLPAAMSRLAETAPTPPAIVIHYGS
jgi:NADPH:quinone reductase-like Zn-dependent oxidoreductase